MQSYQLWLKLQMGYYQLMFITKLNIGVTETDEEIDGWTDRC